MRTCNSVLISCVLMSFVLHEHCKHSRIVSGSGSCMRFVVIIIQTWCYILFCCCRDDNILLHAIVGTMAHELVPGFTFTACKFWDPVGTVILFLLHVGPVECVYYWAHRALHHHYLFSRYHSHHHSSFVTEPVTGDLNLHLPPLQTFAHCLDYLLMIISL